MIEIKRLTEYNPAAATAMRGLLVELSRSGKDKGEIPEQWFLDVISSPWHDVLLAVDGEVILGMCSLSIIMGAGIGKNAYLEDFVVSETARGQGVGEMLWEAMLEWGKEKGAKRMEFTCGNGREMAQKFYKNHGASVYETNFFRKELE
ncbi:GNAT family N-acetyltransferase [Candidatus Saccharibacteria bacterium]|nr:GNAT family N-acetyltransferase [Candidatus Saccharibacteria bacterium]